MIKFRFKNHRVISRVSHGESRWSPNHSDSVIDIFTIYILQKKGWVFWRDVQVFKTLNEAIDAMRDVRQER